MGAGGGERQPSVVREEARHHAAATAYGFRHTYATDWLLNGGTIKVLADLIGTSVSMIERHYGHLMVDKDRVRSIMTSVMGGRWGRRTEGRRGARVSGAWAAGTGGAAGELRLVLGVPLLAERLGDERLDVGRAEEHRAAGPEVRQAARLDLSVPPAERHRAAEVAPWRPRRG